MQTFYDFINCYIVCPELYSSFEELYYAAVAADAIAAETLAFDFV